MVDLAGAPGAAVGALVVCGVVVTGDWLTVVVVVFVVGVLGTVVRCVIAGVVLVRALPLLGPLTSQFY